MEAIMYSCHIFEISQVSERKMRITLLLFFHKSHTSTSAEVCASVQGAKIVIIFLTTKRFRVFLGKNNGCKLHTDYLLFKAIYLLFRKKNVVTVSVSQNLNKKNVSVHIITLFLFTYNLLIIRYLYINI
jgi:hypothetical protein